MKANFIILWIDDTPTFIESVSEPILDLLNEKGFTGDIKIHKDEKGVLDDLRTSDVDLLVIDYGLPKKTGDELIEEIRSKHYYQDIIFYSQDGRPVEPFKDNPPDGVFFVHRDDAKDIIKRIISLKMKRLASAVFFRGWVVADAIEIENMLCGILLQCFEPKKQLKFGERMFGEEGPLEFGAKYKVLNGILKDHILALRGEPGKEEELKKLEACKRSLDLFPEEVIEVRNAVAHQKTEVADTGHRKIKTKTKKAKEIVITEAECIKIRTNLRKHRENLVALSVLI